MTATIRHLRPRGKGIAQPTTTVELFFDLVYVFAITQLSHQILRDLSVAGVARAAFLLLVVWWAWIYTTWMANWFDPASPVVRWVLTAVMLASLLMAAALPNAFGKQGLAFAVELRRAAGRSQRRSGAATRIAAIGCATCSSGWSSGAPLPACCGWPARRSRATSGSCCGYPPSRSSSPRPRRATGCRAAAAPPRPPTTSRATHFVERCQTFILIALGESIVVTGATASAAGLTSTVVLCLIVAFVETAALWWLYFGTTAEHARAKMSICEDPGRLARDAYTYLHVPIIAGIIATAVANDLLIAGPHDAPRGVTLAMILGGPGLYLLGESLFHWRMTGVPKAPHMAVAALLFLLAPLGGHVETLPLSIFVAALLSVLAVGELRPAGLVGTSTRPRRRSLAPGRS